MDFIITSKCFPMKKDPDRGLCQGCLSNDRILAPLKNNVDLFLYLLGHQNALPDTGCNVSLCWECVALLKNIQKFRNRIQHAQSIVQQSLFRLNTTMPCLSSLSITKIQKPEYSMQHKESVIINSLQSIPENELQNTRLPEKMVENEQKTFDIEISTVYCKQESEDYFDNNQDVEFEIPKEEMTYNRDKLDNGNYELDQEDIVKLEKDKTKVKKREKKKVKLKRGLKQLGNKAEISVNNEMNADNYEIFYRKVFFNDEDLRTVIERPRYCSTTKKYAFKCKDCKMTFRMTVDWKRHCTFVHKTESEPPFKCLECGATNPSWSELKTHWEKHNYILKCTLCRMERRRDCDMKRHLRLHSHVYSCNECHARFFLLKDFNRHYNSLHKTLICDHCGHRFLSKTTIEKHIRHMHMTNKCTECPKEYRIRRALIRHYRNIHPHVLNRTIDKEAAYCVECDKQFSSVDRFRGHLRTAACHTPPKRVRVPCPDCDKVFSRRTYMNNHYKLEHKGKSNHHCDICGKFFTSAWGARQHRRFVHEKVPLPRNKVCDICGRSFTTNRILVNHRRTHTGERPFQCPHCAAAFAQNTALASHVRSQHKSKAEWPGQTADPIGVDSRFNKC